ncbi:AMP-binding protein [Streptomyces sp. NPDC086554]|uniref:AMP-binding protein n=1 Tax=Streptomyces sp. NPDC086554 TaxID=3154864 RepID=UPI00341D7A2F
MQLFDALTNSASRGVLHEWTGDEFTHTPWRDVVKDAHKMATELRRLGVTPGARVATILTNTPDTVRGLLAVWLAGGAVASLPLPTRGQSSEEYTGQLTALAARLDPSLVVADEWLTPLVPEKLSRHIPVRSWAALHGSGSGRFEASPPGPDDVAFIQYSSGSTSTPKGCALTTRSIETQMEIILHLTGGRPGADTFASWLPLSHDMGMFGALLYPWAYDFDLVLSTPERFGMAPRSWFRDMSEYGATITTATSTAVYLAARAQGRADLPKPLQLRSAVVGAERIGWDVLVAAAEKFRQYGLAETAFQPAYGMAEATLAITAKPWAQKARSLAFDGAALLDGSVVEVAPDQPGAAILVSNGPALPGIEVAAGPAGTVEEIRVNSPSLAQGYYGDPERTAARFRDGWFRTGDFGFVHDDELFVMGRADDMLSVGGRKVYASEIEAAIDSLPAVRKGCAALIDAGSGTNRFVLILEPKGVPKDFAPIADEAAELALKKAGLPLTECLFVRRGVLPKTPSGKLQRFRCRALLAEDRLDPMARVAYA